MALTDEAARNFDLNDPATVDNLNDVFAQMRKDCPVSFSERNGGYWVITGYESLIDAAKNWQSLTSTQSLIIPAPPEELDPSRKSPPLSSDPPLHRQYRRILNPFFTPIAVAEYETAIRQVANDVIDLFADSSECDLLRDFGVPLPAIVVLEHIVGMPEESMAKFRELLGVAPDRTTSRAEEPIENIEFLTLMFSEVTQYLEARAKQSPRGDVIDAIRTGTIGGEPINLDNQVRMVTTLFLAASMTTTDAIAHSCLYLAAHKEDRERLVANPSMIDKAIEEFLRLSSPVTGDGRRVTADFEMYGQELKQGQPVCLAYGAANRDPAEFPDPDRWDPDRPNLSRQVAFGAGHHHCLGSHLARLEVKVALQEILRRFPNMRTVDGADYSRKRGAGNRLTGVRVVLK